MLKEFCTFRIIRGHRIKTISGDEESPAMTFSGCVRNPSGAESPKSSPFRPVMHLHRSSSSHAYCTRSPKLTLFPD